VNHARLSSGPAESTRVNADSGATGEQQAFQLFGGATYRAVLLDTDLIRKCATEVDAFHLSCEYARVRHTQGWYADQLGVDRGQFSKMLNGSARFAVNPSELAALTGNLALVQFYALSVGCDLCAHRATERERIEALERKAAMYDQEHGGT
jgi:hypothetical protein